MNTYEYFSIDAVAFKQNHFSLLCFFNALCPSVSQGQRDTCKPHIIIIRPFIEGVLHVAGQQWQQGDRKENNNVLSAVGIQCVCVWEWE